MLLGAQIEKVDITGREVSVKKPAAFDLVSTPSPAPGLPLRLLFALFFVIMILSTCYFSLNISLFLYTSFA